MGFLDKLMGKKEICIYAPLEGECVPLSEVSDPTFGEGVLGKGIAIKPSNGKVFAPVDAQVSTIFPTGHAIALTTGDGVELLIHVGLDTVKLDGKYYTKHVKDGDKVKKGDLLLEMDLAGIKSEEYDTITPVIICNTEEFASITTETGHSVDLQNVIITAMKS